MAIDLCRTALIFTICTYCHVKIYPLPKHQHADILQPYDYNNTRVRQHLLYLNWQLTSPLTVNLNTVQDSTKVRHFHAVKTCTNQVTFYPKTIRVRVLRSEKKTEHLYSRSQKFHIGERKYNFHEFLQHSNSTKSTQNN